MYLRFLSACGTLTPCAGAFRCTAAAIARRAVSALRGFAVAGFHARGRGAGAFVGQSATPDARLHVFLLLGCRASVMSMRWCRGGLSVDTFLQNVPWLDFGVC